MGRLDQERQKKLEPQRIEHARKKIEAAGKVVEIRGKSLHFMHQGYQITFYPYSGWASGKTIKDGRGLKNLLKQIEKHEKPGLYS